MWVANPQPLTPGSEVYVSLTPPRDPPKPVCKVIGMPWHMTEPNLCFHFPQYGLNAANC